MNPTRNHEVLGLIPSLTQWIKDLALREMWCRSLTWLRSGVAEAVVYSSDWTSSLGTSTCCACGPKKTKEEKRKKWVGGRKRKEEKAIVNQRVVCLRLR